MIRDQALAFSGLLAPTKRGGPAVKPYQPEGIWEEASFGKIKYKPGTGDAICIAAVCTRSGDASLGRRCSSTMRHAADLHGQGGAHEHAAARADHAERDDLRRECARDGASGF